MHEKYPELILHLDQNIEGDEVQADQQQGINEKLAEEVLQLNPSANSEATITSVSQLARSSDAPTK